MTIKAQLQAIFSAYQTHHDFSGVALVKTETDVLHAGAYGYASRPWRIANTLHTRFDTASITKLFTMRCVATELGGKYSDKSFFAFQSLLFGYSTDSE